MLLARRRYKKEFERLGCEREHLNVKRDTQRSIARVKRRFFARECKIIPKPFHLGPEQAITAVRCAQADFERTKTDDATSVQARR